METSAAGAARVGAERRSQRDLVRPWVIVARPAATLLTGIPRTARRLFDRVGLGLRTFDDNLWDGGDET
jgi:hypothetical protein